MNGKSKFVFFLLLCSMLAFCAAGQPPDTLLQPPVIVGMDSIHTVPGSESYDDTFFTAGLFTMTVIVLLVFLILVIIGIVAAALILLLILGLASMSILSASIVVGLYHRSLKKGFRTFVVGCFTLGGLVLGAVFLAALNRVMHWTDFETAVITGSGIGAVSGYVAGLLAFSLLKRWTRSFLRKRDSSANSGIGTDR